MQAIKLVSTLVPHGLSFDSLLIRQASCGCIFWLASGRTRSSIGPKRECTLLAVSQDYGRLHVMADGIGTVCRT